MTIQRTTLHGHKATRRIKWFNLKDVVKKDGKSYVDVFVVAVIEEDGFKLFAVTAQLGIDMRGRHVLPYSQVVPQGGRFAYGGKSEGTTCLYLIGAEVGNLEAAGQNLVDNLNRIHEETKWVPPLGMSRGKLDTTIQGKLGTFG